MRLAPLVVSADDRMLLGLMTRSRSVALRDVQRAWIVLLAADGWSNRAIGDEVGMHYNQVAVWRRRFAAKGLAGLIDLSGPVNPRSTA